MKNLNFEIKSKSDVLQSMYLNWSLEITNAYKLILTFLSLPVHVKIMAPFSKENKLKVALSQKRLEDFYSSKINIPNPEQTI